MSNDQAKKTKVMYILLRIVQEYSTVSTRLYYSYNELLLACDQGSQWGGALRDDTKNGCVADYDYGS